MTLCNTNVILCNTDAILYNTDVILCNTDVILCDTDVILCNTDVILCDTDMILCNTDTILCNTHMLLHSPYSSGVIEIIVLPNEDGPEPEETFTVTLISASNNVFILPDQSSVTISVAQVGMPFGVIAFFGDALQLRRVSEQETISLPLIRTEETVGATVVLFTVTGDSPNLDVSPVSSNVSFGTGQSQANLVLEILSDSTPELEETYTVTLREATGGAAINPLAAVSMFVIRYLDYYIL